MFFNAGLSNCVTLVWKFMSPANFQNILLVTHTGTLAETPGHG